MKTTIFYLFIILISISSCNTTYNTYNYSDPNYLASNEFTSVSNEEKETIVIIEKDINSNDCSLNVSQFASGIYFIEVRTSGATIRRELIIANDIK